MIKLRNISLQRNGKQILENVDLDFPPGVLTMILGPNGAGKTSLFEILTGQLTPQRGYIRWEKELFGNWSAKEMAIRRTVLSQQVHINFPIQVEDLVGMGNYAVRNLMNNDEHLSIVRDALRKVGLSASAKRSYPSLSGGEQQRVLLAKCIVQLESNFWRPHTQYLFLDEATANLDIKQKHEMMQLVKNIIQRRGIGVVAIVHDLGLAATYADRIILLKQGKVLAQGDCKTTLTSAHISKTFELEAHQVPSLTQGSFSHLT